MHVQADQRPWSNRIDVHMVLRLFGDADDGTVHAAQALTFVKVEVGAMSEAPAMSLRPEEVQMLMDEL